MIQEVTQRHFDDSVMRQGSLVFDIGGLHGDFASAMLDRGYKVICFEPDPTGFERIPRRSNLEVIQKAVSGCTGRRSFFRYAPCDGANGFFLNKSENSVHPAQIIEVETISLKDAVMEYGVPELVKFNCEGAEVEIIMLTPTNILKQIHQLSISFHVFCDFKEMGEKEVKQCTNKLTRAGFDLSYYPEYEDECYAVLRKGT